VDFRNTVGHEIDVIPAMNAAPTTADSILQLAKASLERLGATPNDPDDSILTNIGQRDDAATADDLSDITTTSIEAKLRRILLKLLSQGVTTFSQETAIATDVDGTNWKTLLDKSTLTKYTQICGIKVTVAGTWAGLAKLRIIDGAGTKLWPFGSEVVQNTDFTSGNLTVLNFTCNVPAATGYKLQFRSSDGGDGAGDTVQLNNLDVISVG
jgi:hypothetical protein